MPVKVKKRKSKRNLTEISLLVSDYETEVNDYDKEKIVGSLILETQLSREDALKVANLVEERLIKSEFKVVNTDLIRELIDSVFVELGLVNKLKKQKVIGMPIYDLKQMFKNKTCENSNVLANNPEALSALISEHTFKQYMLQEVFTRDVSLAHLEGVIHIHDMGYPRVYCSSHSLEYIKLYGLNLLQLDTKSKPAKHAHTLTGHLNTFLSIMQAYYAGALGIGFLNIFYAPFLKGMTFEQMKQEAQYLIYQSSQNAFSRGGQNLFLDFNIHLGVPEYLKKVPIIINGERKKDETYGMYEKETRDFARALLEIWAKGDRDGRPFAFPKMDLHIDENSFADEEQRKLLKYACEIASESGTPYFVFDRGKEATLSQCCRLKTKVTDPTMLEHPETMRFCGFQNVSINLPQAAYRAKKIENIYKEIDRSMQLAIKAHLQKKKFIESLMYEKGQPLYQLGVPGPDGKPYLDINNATYIIGIIGLNECIKFLLSKELHEDEEMLKAGLKIIAHMNIRCKEYSKEHNLNFLLEESPAESASPRLAKIDVRTYPESKDVIKGDLINPYYTNSIHFAADAPVNFVDRIVKQSKFHPLVESGSIIHAWIGEQKPDPESIFNLTEKIYKETQCAQYTISPEFTICEDCKGVSRGIKTVCPKCQSQNVYSITRIVGYFSRINNWNDAKKKELEDRHKTAERYKI